MELNELLKALNGVAAEHYDARESIRVDRRLSPDGRDQYLRQTHDNAASRVQALRAQFDAQRAEAAKQLRARWESPANPMHAREARQAMVEADNLSDGGLLAYVQHALAAGDRVAARAGAAVAAGRHRQVLEGGDLDARVQAINLYGEVDKAFDEAVTSWWSAAPSHQDSMRDAVLIEAAVAAALDPSAHALNGPGITNAAAAAVAG